MIPVSNLLKLMRVAIQSNVEAGSAIPPVAADDICGLLSFCESECRSMEIRLSGRSSEGGTHDAQNVVSLVDYLQGTRGRSTPNTGDDIA